MNPINESLSYKDYQSALESAQVLRAQELKRILDHCYSNISSMTKSIFQKDYEVKSATSAIKVG